jgi:hypothetical protein
MGVSTPLPHQGRAGLHHNVGIEGTSAFLEVCRQSPKAALLCAARAPMGALLQLIGEPPDDQIATEAQGRSGVMQCPPRTPQLLCRLTDQPGDFYQRQALQPLLPAVVGTETAGRLARGLASRSVVNWRFHRFAGSAMR